MKKTEFGERLVQWYLEGHRDLPWRKTNNPYHIWLSEIMLQQTQVATVLPYYEKFLKLFPTVQDLADAPLGQVLKAWEGLGYYARSRNLHKAAQKIVNDYGGRFPDTLADMEGLPGIGRSTAGAILTFAFGQCHPILDGNVKRVLTRLYDIDEDPALVLTRLWELSKTLIEPSPDPYHYNQAIMELGATVCTPKEPSCLICPVKDFCEAAEQGTQHERPLRPPKKILPHHTIAAGVIWHEGRIFIQQRPPEGLLGGLWEFPGGKQESGETLEQTVVREIEEESAIQVAVGEKITIVKHAYTHFKITLHAYYCHYISGTPSLAAATDWRWVLPEELEQYAFPKANKTLLPLIRKITEN